jgi:hypothetical protein
LVAQNSLISQVRKNLEQCGYSNGLLRTDYVYEDGTGEHTVILAGFARPVYDSRTSCISVIKCDELLRATEQYVNQFRGLGAPIIFVCCNGTLQWWNVGTRGAKCEKTVSKNEVKGFFSAHKEEFSPDRIWRAKNLGRVDTTQQLSFVDIGLMPLLEYEMGKRLGGLMNRIIGLLRNGFANKQLKMPQNQRWIFRAAFWLLCAKILKDKGVNGFLRIDLGDVDNVLKAVKNHYQANPKELVIVQTEQQAQALKDAAEEIKKFASLSNLTTEAFAYMYENVLVDKNLRSALGIHATPSYLVDYIVWQLWPWIRQIPEDRRVILEPACGHAPFLTGAMRLLRELFEGSENEFHGYAQKHLTSIEMDSFAREIARLSLTIADVPNPNGWKIEESDIYQDDILSKKAEKAKILLCNPPFGNFTLAEQRVYKSTGQKLNCFNKAAEMLWRTLPYMSKGSVFGVVLPQGFLHKPNLAQLRKMLVEQFELAEICTLPENVFSTAKHKSTVLLGRKYVDVKKMFGLSNKIRFRRIQKWELDRFRDSYRALTDEIYQSKFDIPPLYDFRLQLLHEVWEYCHSFSRLSKVTEGGRGLEYKTRPKKGESYNRKKHLQPNAQTISDHKFTGAIRGCDKFARNIMLTETPKLFWMNLAPEVISRPRWGTETGTPQVLLNSIRVGDGPWRLKALIDSKGYPVTTRFIVVRPKIKEWSLEAIWAILNSPLANAYAYCHSLERNNQTGTIRNIPIPNCDPYSLHRLTNLVQDYFDLYDSKGKILHSDVDAKEARHRMLAIDAEVMKLYNLPPKLERHILYLFAGWERKGVDFQFKGYYPEGFESAVPLHEYLSDEYQRSTITFVDEWVKKNRSPEINEVLRTATEAFEEK